MTSDELIKKEVKTYGSATVEINGRKRFCWRVKCDWCNQIFYKEQSEILRGIRNNKKFYCSRECSHTSTKTKENVSCANCGISFLKLVNQILKTKNNFCSKSCAATFNNKHKKYGTRRSKMEVLIEEMLKTDFPDLKFKANAKDEIGSELDFYFPDLKLAIQINGIFHYMPIYGQEKLDSIRRLDKEKRKLCKKIGIKLVEINCSKDKYLNKKKIASRLEQVKTILFTYAKPQTQ